MDGISETAGSTVAEILGLCGSSVRHCRVSKLNECSPYSAKQKKDLDSLYPSSTFIRADGPPVPSHFGFDTVPARRCEQEGRDECNAKHVKGDHPCPGK